LAVTVEEWAMTWAKKKKKWMVEDVVVVVERGKNLKQKQQKRNLAVVIEKV
jgi:hypothetical protein